jgi:hypothetical protein
VGRFEEHRAALRGLPAGDWDAYLAASSGLPGPRANLELARAVAEEAPAATVRRYAAADDEYLALLCGAAGLGRLLAGGDPAAETELARLADDRWRVREGDDPDVRWLVRENLKKSRLTRADPEGLARLRALALDPGGPIDR